MVAHFTYEYHVWILSQRTAQGFGERTRIDVDFTLRHKRLLVAMQKFDRIFDGDDVTAARRVNAIDHRRQRCRLSGSSRAGDEDETAPFLGDLLYDRRQTELCNALRVIGNNAQHNTHRAALLKKVCTKASQS